MNCPTCQNEIQDNSIFCPICGTKIKNINNIANSTTNMHTYTPMQQNSYAQPHQYTPRQQYPYQQTVQPPVAKDKYHKNMVYHYIFAIGTIALYAPFLPTQLFSIFFNLQNIALFIAQLLTIAISGFFVTTSILLLMKKKIGYYFSKAVNICSGLSGLLYLVLSSLVFLEAFHSTEYAGILIFCGIFCSIVSLSVIAIAVITFIYYCKRKDFFIK